MGDAVGSPLAEAMNHLWAKYLPLMEARVATLRQAAEQLAKGELTAPEQREAAADAHKLAGVLGTFGLKEATDLAREAESLYDKSQEEVRPLAARLAAIAEQLRAMIAGRK